MQQGIRAAYVIGIAMTQDESMDDGLAASTQERQQHLVRGIAISRQAWPGVIERHMVLCAHHHGGALPHIATRMGWQAVPQGVVWRQ